MNCPFTNALVSCNVAIGCDSALAGAVLSQFVRWASPTLNHFV